MGIPQAMVWGGAVDSGDSIPRFARRPVASRDGLRGSMRWCSTSAAWPWRRIPRLWSRASVRLMRRWVKPRSSASPEPAPRPTRYGSALPFARHFGFLSRERLAELYADADLFVFPSPTETCGLVALEAMASGLPVIGAAAGGIRESIMPGITGHLIEPGNATEFATAIQSLVKDRERREAMGQAARAFAQGRDWSRELDQLEALYRRARDTTAAVAAPTSWPTTTSVT